LAHPNQLRIDHVLEEIVVGVVVGGKEVVSASKAELTQSYAGASP
jgi:hypothetical protein